MRIGSTRDRRNDFTNFILILYPRIVRNNLNIAALSITNPSIYKRRSLKILLRNSSG